MITSLLSEIPSPPQSVWHLGPFPVRAYALAILVGIVVAIFITQRRWKARGGNPEDVIEVVLWAVPFGIVGGRLYHVITSPTAYFGPDGDPVRALYVWEGGLGIWGAIALGAVGAWIGARRMGMRLPPFADAVAPGILVAQAIGRLGNWFNQELYGRATTLPWGLRIDNPTEPGTLFHPTFLYEMVWCLVVAVVLVVADRRWRLGHGRVFAGYVALYCAGRLWIETLRIDAAEKVLGLRLNVWTALVVGVCALLAFVIIGRRHPDRETVVYRASRLATARAATGPDADAAARGVIDPADEPTDPEDEPDTSGSAPPTPPEPDDPCDPDDSCEPSDEADESDGDSGDTGDSGGGDSSDSGGGGGD